LRQLDHRLELDDLLLLQVDPAVENHQQGLLGMENKSHDLPLPKTDAIASEFSRGPHWPCRLGPRP
jgi:hypothetical protein